MTIFAQVDLSTVSGGTTQVTNNNLVYTVAGGPASLGATVNIRFTNRNSSTAYITCAIVPSAGSISVASVIEWNATIDAYLTLEELNIPLGTGDKIYANPSASGITCCVWGLNN